MSTEPRTAAGRELLEEFWPERDDEFGLRESVAHTILAIEREAAERASGGREPPGEWLRRVWDGPEPSLEDFRRNPDAVYEWFAAERASGGLDVEALAEAIRNTYLAPSASRDLDARNIAAEYARLTGGQDDE